MLAGQGVTLVLVRRDRKSGMEFPLAGIGLAKTAPELFDPGDPRE